MLINTSQVINLWMKCCNIIVVLFYQKIERAIVPRSSTKSYYARAVKG